LKILVTGGSGLLGRALWKTLGRRHEVVPVDRSAQDGAVQADITVIEQVMDVVKEAKPDCVMHTAAMTDLDFCEMHPEDARKVNVLGTRNVAKAAQEARAKVVYVSTDYVFDGRKGNYSEEDEPRPQSVYARTKLEGEFEVKKHSRNYAIARTSRLYGWNPAKTNFVTWVLKELGEGREIKTIAGGQYTSPTYAGNLAEALARICEKDLRGIYHAAGSQRIDPHGFALEVAEVFSLNKELVKKIDENEMRWLARRPHDSSLKVKKIERDAGVKMLSVKEGLKRMKKDGRKFLEKEVKESGEKVE
jgi:dTDP-4-dehydrorhamnose reductase